MDKAERQRLSEVQTELLELAIRRSSGDLILASALMLSTGARASLLFLLDPMDLFEEVSQLIADHIKKRDGK
jgi:hypothetical protein